MSRYVLAVVAGLVLGWVTEVVTRRHGWFGRTLLCVAVALLSITIAFTRGPLAGVVVTVALTALSLWLLPKAAELDRRLADN